MARKADFDPAEWTTLMEGPLIAGMSVLGAARGGLIRESLAIGETYARARKHHRESDLLDDLVSETPTIDPDQVPPAGAMADAAVERLRLALELLEQRASAQEIEAYKRFVMSVAEAAAGANREGGFLGIGGQPVSERERAALDALAAALQLQR